MEWINIVWEYHSWNSWASKLLIILVFFLTISLLDKKSQIVLSILTLVVLFFPIRKHFTKPFDPLHPEKLIVMNNELYSSCLKDFKLYKGQIVRFNYKKYFVPCKREVDYKILYQNESLYFEVLDRIKKETKWN